MNVNQTEFMLNLCYVIRIEFIINLRMHYDVFDLLLAKF